MRLWLARRAMRKSIKRDPKLNETEKALLLERLKTWSPSP